MEKVLKNLKDFFIKNNLKISTGESCTGGLISSYLTDIDGASDFVEQNFVTYAPEAKEKFLDVKKSAIEKYSVVSPQVAHQMAKGLLKYADISIATTGYAAPTGGDKKNPPGTVYIGLGIKKGKKSNIKTIEYHSALKTRVQIKKDFAKKALEELLSFLQKEI